MSAVGNDLLFPQATVIPAGDLNPQPNGYYTLTINGTTKTVLSVAADGKWGEAPEGSNGPNELCGLNGNTLVFNPAGQMFAYPYFPSCPGV